MTEHRSSASTPRRRPRQRRGARVVAVQGSRGGAGATCITLGLAEAAARQGFRVCGLDLDPRAALTTALVDTVDGPTLKDVIRLDEHAVPLNDTTVESSWPGVWASPAERTLQNRERDLGTVHARTRFRQRVEQARPDWDLILMDIPSGLSNLALAGIVAADALVIASTATPWALAGINEIVYTLERLEKTHPQAATLSGIAVTLYDDSAQAKRTLTEIREAFGHLVWSPPVPRYAAVQLAAEVHRMPLDTYAEAAPLRAREARTVANIHAEFVSCLLPVT
nr:ParA family protein [Nonomuraea diastatica]